MRRLVSMPDEGEVHHQGTETGLFPQLTLRLRSTDARPFCLRVGRPYDPTTQLSQFAHQHVTRRVRIPLAGLDVVTRRPAPYDSPEESCLARSALASHRGATTLVPSACLPPT
jgi:hypothetical protein